MTPRDLLPRDPAFDRQAALRVITNRYRAEVRQRDIEPAQQAFNAFLRRHPIDMTLLVTESEHELVELSREWTGPEL